MFLMVLLLFFDFIVLWFDYCKGSYTENHVVSPNNDKILSVIGKSKLGVEVMCDFSYGSVFKALGSASLTIKSMTIISGDRREENIIDFESSGSLSLDNVIIKQNDGFFFFFFINFIYHFKYFNQKMFIIVEVVV
jgi:hypothetical protein